MRLRPCGRPVDLDGAASLEGGEGTFRLAGGAAGNQARGQGGGAADDAEVQNQKQNGSYGGHVREAPCDRQVGCLVDAVPRRSWLWP